MSQLFCTVQGPCSPWIVERPGSNAASVKNTSALVLVWQDTTSETLAGGTYAQTSTGATAIDMTTGASWLVFVYQGAQTAPAAHALLLVQENNVSTIDAIVSGLKGSAGSWAILGKAQNDGSVLVWQQG